MIELTDLLAAGGRLHGTAQARSFADFSYDSRLTRPGELFVALRTPHADGHDYIGAALAAGAAGVLCAWPPAAANTTIVQASDPPALLQRWAARRLAQVAPTVIGVTGSVGKTSAVRTIAALLAVAAPTFRSRQSFNSLFGLPIALARLRDDQRFAVLEFGADRHGEIARLAELFPPHIAVVTAVGAAHLDAFGTLDGVAREQAALVAALPPDGWAILNGDDRLVAAMRGRTGARVLTFGFDRSNDLAASPIDLALAGTRFQLHWRMQTIEAWVPLLGRPAIAAALAGVAVALACGIPLAQAAAALAQLEPIDGRLRALPGRSGATLIDDSYSGTLPATLAALHTLAALPARRRIAVLGAPELPAPGAEQAYKQIGALAATHADQLICQGDWGVLAVAAARRQHPAINATVAHTSAAVLAALPPDLGSGDLVLIKGAAAARMERVTAALLADPAGATRWLVRQQPAWRTVRTGMPGRPTWLQIDLDAIAHNIQRLGAMAGVPLMVVLKADAYGHGALRVAHTALASGARALAVATLGEAQALRAAGITAPILVLGYTPPWQARAAVALGVACTIFDLDAARALAEAADSLDRTATAHLKIDTGMARLGLPPAQAAPFLRALRDDLPHAGRLRVEGIYTHFAAADSAEQAFAHAQLRLFEQLLAELGAAGLRPPVAHAANSAALLRLPAARLDMARPGIACYGLRPSPDTPLPPEFQPALSFHTEVAQVKLVPAGAPISYGGAYVTPSPALIATIPAGYADGLRRAPQPWRTVLVRGRRAPIVGRICMDYAMIDVSAIPGVRRGDPVVLIGTQGGDTISADEVAGWLGTIAYEVVATILPRVPREVG
ncbi:MAG: alanine racemase [Kouleothrix sp.]|nr:alanine racemase [Kouleothrix sp.]